ncbi:hypothetical protein C1646_758817 [Rhizophagus diaphanus]|nr:hypothetical protein C1646_758817 [Rhizophagus diaphanus] [Rhizophagus sp. MUCL 43196]
MKYLLLAVVICLIHALVSVSASPLINEARRARCAGDGIGCDFLPCCQGLRCRNIEIIDKFPEETISQLKFQPGPLPNHVTEENSSTAEINTDNDSKEMPDELDNDDGYNGYDEYGERDSVM